MSLFFEKSNPEMENKEIIAAEEEHYDGSGMTDVYENYNSVRRDAHGDYVPVHFVETRKYLQKVRDLKRHIELLENRISYRIDAGLDVEKHESELEELKQGLKAAIADVSEQIGKLHDINQQVVMTKRYIDMMSWEEIAESADFKMRTVQKLHGRTLPRMEQILLDDGLIELVTTYEPEE